MSQPQQHQQRTNMTQAADFAYTISKSHNGGEWMLAEIDTPMFAFWSITWTKSWGSALVFFDADEAQDLIDVFDVLQGCRITRTPIGN